MIKSKFDKRQYKHYELKNKLNILLISDTLTDKSAVSMNVSVGCFHDPPKYPGMAHFLEHMLFMGTKKYPDENKFSEYLGKYNGIYNAYTATDCTNYHLQINSEYFYGILDIFGQFFIDPLFKKNSIDRELKAINSEHSKNLQNDGRRVFSILRILSKKNHPSHKFCTGNLETLKKDDIYKELLIFYKKWYSANIMNLVVIDKNPLEYIEKKVNSIFSKIVNNNVKIPTNIESPYENKQLLVNIKPVAEINNLEIFCNIDSKNDEYFKTSLYFITKLINYKGENSFYTLLKNKDYIYDLYSSYMNFYNYSYYLFNISFELTDKGLSNIETINKLFYQYIYYLRQQDKKTLENIFNNINSINALNFMFKSKENPFDYVINIAENMQHYNKKYYLVGDILLRKFKYPIIINILDKILKQININFVITKQTDIKNFDTEHFYKTEYKSKETKNFIEQKELKYKFDINIPQKNDYIPQNFDIKEPKQKLVYPYTLISNSSSEYWFKQDYIFKLPRCYIFIKLINPIVIQSAKNYILNEIFVNIIQEIFTIKLYDYYSVGNSLFISNQIEGFSLDIFSYNDKLNLKQIFDIIINEKITKHLFKSNLEQLIKYYNNKQYETPIQQAHRCWKSLLIQNYISINDKQKALSNITIDDVINFRKLFFKSLYIKTMFHGNIDKKNAYNYIKVINNITDFKNKISEYPKFNIIKLNNKYIYDSKCTNTDENDSAILYYIQLGRMNFQLNNLIELISIIIKDPFFDTLRTKEQLGYLVFSRILLLRNIVGFSFEIQGSAKDPHFLQNRIEQFIDNFYNELLNIDIHKYIDSLIQNKQEKYNNIHEEFSFNTNEIKLSEYIFNRKKIDSNNLKRITKKDVISFFYNHFIKHKKMLIIHIHGKSSNNKYNTKLDGHITSIDKFKQNKKTI